MRLSCAIVLAVASISHFAALRLIEAPGYLEALQPEQLNGLAVLAMRLYRLRESQRGVGGDNESPVDEEVATAFLQVAFVAVEKMQGRPRSS
jgi:hypothetical protein